MEIINPGIVYMITSPTYKVYVGSTKNFNKRVKAYSKYRCKTQIKLYNSLIKYGWENHKIEIVWKGPLDKMLRYETLIGLFFNVLDFENLNLKLPKINDVYQIVSNETREKMSKSRKGRIVSEETRLKIIKGNLGKKRSIESRLNISKGKKGKFTSFLAIQKMQQINMGHKYNLGKKHTKETIEKRTNKMKKPIIQYDLNMNFIKEWKSIKDASDELKICKSGITQCCQGMNRYSHSGGFKWKLKN